MLYSKILVPYDCSEHANEAVAYAKGLLELNPEATMVVVHAIAAGTLSLSGGDSIAYGQIDFDQYKALVDAAMQARRAEVDAAMGDALADMGERASVEIVPGIAPAETLARYATEHGCDLIVMGRRGLGAVRGMLGSVSFGLLRESDVPIITVK